MGTQVSIVSTADALFPSVLQRVLILLFSGSGAAIQSAELIRRVDRGTGAVHRVLQRLEAGSLVEVERIGSQKFYRPNRLNPVFEELRGLIRKTIGLAAPLRQGLARLEPQIEAAFVFGSIARGDESPDSDVDLMVLSDSISYGDLYEVLPPIEEAIGRQIQPLLEAPSEWRQKLRDEHPFTVGVQRGPKLFVIGSEDGLR